MAPCFTSDSITRLIMNERVYKTSISFHTLNSSLIKNVARTFRLIIYQKNECVVSEGVHSYYLYVCSIDTLTMAFVRPRRLLLIIFKICFSNIQFSTSNTHHNKQNSTGILLQIYVICLLVLYRCALINNRVAFASKAA